MTDKLVLLVSEKPSVSREIAKIVGATSKKDGYFEGNGWIVSYCFGHLLQSAAPEVYDERYKIWKMEDLPIFPDKWQYVVSENRGVKKQFSILCKLMNDKRVGKIVNSCDAGREGELIFRLVYGQSSPKSRSNVSGFPVWRKVR
jgi:DNA topoisomerase-3